MSQLAVRLESLSQLCQRHAGRLREALEEHRDLLKADRRQP